ncbi:hypothetical protein M406DRAFT_340337 [Cryphonectria parasitica EP155]|uniref:RRM domain-containing protein n=1 Tax=Cryphonectria parasitica (strain ATCC 38755 / EP155) TaxID=660469 RepID=A0A9P5CN50_CRYP1|nr:uncharacterized protein M406DRAFT_340337 [Cryphonectria parasitica EP155]KAF3764808.1 hypothetical protein M406DRAFT_340337 [Cryphonectria parasitica EP155]
MADHSIAEVLTFPTDPAQFDNDDRISFSRLDNKYIAVQESDGTEFEFDAQLKRWVPVMDEAEEALIQQQQSAYGSINDASYGDGDAQVSNGRKRRRDDLEDQDNNNNDNAAASSSNGRRKNKKQASQPKQPPQNRAVYVTGLPLDVTVDEVAEVFSRKCGVIAEEIDSGRPRIKLYADAAGNFKGDALVVFFKPQSVNMAIMLLDDTHFRYTESGLGSGKMRVQAADTSYKKTQQQQPVDGEGAGGEGAQQPHQTNNGRGGPGNNSKDREKVIKKTQKLDAKLADWSDDEPAYIPPEQRTGKRDKMVILKHMFTKAELDEDPAALLEIKEDIRDECEKLGEVTNVVLYDLEPEGVVSIKFRKPEAADACVQLMDGRSFGGQRVEAYIPTGKLKFKKSRDNNDDASDEED